MSSEAYLQLNDKLVVVTGAVGIIGSMIVKQLSAHGARIAMVDIDLRKLSELEADISNHDNMRSFVCDLNNPDTIVSTIDEIVSWGGDIDILFNNAATKTNNLERFFDPTEDYSLATWRDVMAVNTDGLFIMARECAKSMKRKGRGSIVQTASIYGVIAPDMRIYEGSEYLGRPINTPPIYAASKGAVISLTRYLAALWARDGIRVNTISPGGVSSGQNGTFVEKYCARVPLARMATAQEIADAALFLASPASSYITGHNLVVDGGMSIW